MTFQEILTQAVAPLNDREQRSIEPAFAIMLMELCLCIILLRNRPTTQSATITFPSSVPLDLFDFFPLIDVNVNTNLPEVTTVVSVTDASGKQLSLSGSESVVYLTNTFSGTEAVPREWYMILSNLLGVRPAPVGDVELTMVYVPYLEVHNLTETFPLDDSYIQHMLQIIKTLLFIRLSRYETAKLEWEKYLTLA